MKIKNAYQFCAYQIFNVFLVLLLLNTGSWIAFYFRDQSRVEKDLDIEKKYDNLAAAYPDLSKEQLHAFLKESWGRTFAYEPFTLFKERTQVGKLVNVDFHGFRMSKNQVAWPTGSDYTKIFFFGGSTAFGYGVNDDESIPSALQESLPTLKGKKTAVFNFGRGHYFSTQERVLFESLWLRNERPDVAVFLDGLNDTLNLSGEPLFSDEIRDIFDGRLERTCAPEITNFQDKLPLMRLVHGLSRQILGTKQLDRSTARDVAYAAAQADESVPEKIVERFLTNKAMIESIAASQNREVLFVWQPVPLYRYDLKYHAFGNAISEGVMREVYAIAERDRNKPEWKKNLLWLADMQQGKKENLYADAVHYNPKFSREIAQAIAARLKKLPLR